MPPKTTIFGSQQPDGCACGEAGSTDGVATSTAAGAGATHLSDLCDELKLNSELAVTPTTKVKRATTRRRAMRRISLLLPNVDRAGERFVEESRQGTPASQTSPDVPGARAH